jgi:hypothetical protein
MDESANELGRTWVACGVKGTDKHPYIRNNYSLTPVSTGFFTIKPRQIAGLFTAKTS